MKNVQHACKPFTGEWRLNGNGFLTLLLFFSFLKIFAIQTNVGEGARKSSVRAGLSSAQPARGRLLWPGVPRKLDRHKVLAGLGEGLKSTSRLLAGGSDAEVLRQILRARPGPARGGVHAISVLPAGQTRPGDRESSVQ